MPSSSIPERLDQCGSVQYAKRTITPVSDLADREAWAAAQELAGVDPVSVHGMRGTTATLLLEAGVDAQVIQQILGHSDVVMTRKYQTVDLELARRGLGPLGGLLEVGTFACIGVGLALVGFGATGRAIAERAEKIRRTAEDRDRAIDACGMCDADGYAHGRDHDHDPGTVDRARRSPCRPR